MYGLLIALHLLICCALIISVLLQSAKGEGLAGAFGGSSLTGTVFGGRGAATFLSKATTVLAIAFFSSSLVIGFLHPSTGTSSVVGGESAVEEAARQAPPPADQPVTQDQTQGQPAQTPPGQEATPIEQLNPETQQQQAPPGDSR